MHGNRKAAGLLYRTKGSLRKTAHECCLPRARVVQAERCVFISPHSNLNDQIQKPPPSMHSKSSATHTPIFTTWHMMWGMGEGRWGDAASPQCHHRVASAQTDKEAPQNAVSLMAASLPYGTSSQTRGDQTIVSRNTHTHSASGHSFLSFQQSKGGRSDYFSSL